MPQPTRTPDAPDTPAADAAQPRGPRPTSGKYVVLYASPDRPGLYEVLTADNTIVHFGGGQESAKRAALQTAPLADMVKDGGVLLVAIPAASWQPTTAKLEPRDPVLRLG